MMEKKLSRRAFIRAAGAMPTAISSVLVRVHPHCCSAASDVIAAMPGAEVVWRAEDGSKLAVVLETDNDADTMRRLHDITATTGVVAADLTYAYNGESSDG